MADWGTRTTIAPAGRDAGIFVGKIFHIWLKEDFPSGPSKKTGYRNTHFFSEWKGMAGIM